VEREQPLYYFWEGRPYHPVHRGKRKANKTGDFHMQGTSAVKEKVLGAAFVFRIWKDVPEKEYYFVHNRQV
jgi:hypothetical protein